MWMVCNGFQHRLHVVCRRVDERRVRRPNKFAGVCGFSVDAIFMEGCRLFQKRPKNRIPTLRVMNDSIITQIGAGNGATDE